MDTHRSSITQESFLLMTVMVKANRENPLHGSKATPLNTEGYGRIQPPGASFFKITVLGHPRRQVTKKCGGGGMRKGCLQSLFPQMKRMQRLPSVQIPALLN